MWASSVGVALALLAVSPIQERPARSPSFLERLEALPEAPREGVLRLALQARECAVRRGLGRRDLLALIDYSLPSTQRRFWLLDLSQPRVLFHELVAHGRGSGENLAQSFSNVPDSKKSSLGLFVTGQPYDGDHGLSLRLDGLEPGINDAARAREIVIHAAHYVSDGYALAHSMIGRSWGCPALPLGVAQRVIERMGERVLLWAYYPDQRWLRSSPFLRCGD